MTTMLPTLAERVERAVAAIGQTAAWCALFVVVAELVVVILRYLFGIGAIWLQESITYAHAALFLLAAAWTLGADGHVRVDIFYAGMSPQRKAIVDFGGALLLLLPFTLAIAVLSLPYVVRSWSILERSRDAGGLPLVFLLKSLIPLSAMLLALQGLAQAARAWSVLASR